jgi:HlyD family secretion protein
MSRAKKKILLYVGTCVAAALALAVYFIFFSAGKEVETVEVKQGLIARTVEDDGYVQPVNDYKVYATQNVKVTGTPVSNGQAVQRGQVLVTMENLDLSIQINDARSQLSQAAANAGAAKASLERSRLELKDAMDNLTRTEELFRAGAATRAEYEKAQLQVDTARQNISEQSSQLDSIQARMAGLEDLLGRLNAKEQELVIKSPVKGIVLDIPVKKDQVLSPGALLADVAPPDQWEIKADILSDDLAEVKEGQKVTITAPVLGAKVLTGEVKKIYPRAEEKKSALGVLQRRVPVLITLSDPANLKPGYEVQVAIETLVKENVLVLPRESVHTTRDGSKEVMAVVNNRIQRLSVETGLSGRDSIEITKGLKAGDRVVRDATQDLAEKTKVKPVENIN